MTVMPENVCSFIEELPVELIITSNKDDLSTWYRTLIPDLQWQFSIGINLDKV